MNNTYTDLVTQTFNFPQEGFEVKDSYLQFNGLDLKALIDKYGTPMKLTYLPKIGMQINKAKKMFANAIKRHRYEGKYHYCYCTKSSHFSFIVEEALKHDIHLETSYANSLACAEQRWGRQVTAIQRDYDASLERMRTQQSTALTRLQRRMTQPQVLRLHGDQRL